MKSKTANKLRDYDDINVINENLPGLSCGDCHSHNILQVEIIFLKGKYGYEDMASEPFLICEDCLSRNIGKICPECHVFKRVKDTIRDEIYCEPCGFVLIRQKQLQY